MPKGALKKTSHAEILIKYSFIETKPAAGADFFCIILMYRLQKPTQNSLISFCESFLIPQKISACGGLIFFFSESVTSGESVTRGSPDPNFFFRKRDVT